MQSLVLEGGLTVGQHSLMHREGRSAAYKQALGNSSHLVFGCRQHLAIHWDAAGAPQNV